jgi:two-component system, OmpR family, response regulator
MSLRAYIVEDSPTIRENLIETLHELAQVEAVGLADTETEGRAWLAQNPDAWDIAVVDLFLRQGSGLRVVEAARQRRHGQKVIVLSNHATSDMRRRCAQLGADAVFDKSTEIDALLDYCVKARGELEMA